MALFTSFAALTRTTLARAESVNALFQAIADGNALLPDPAKLIAGTATFGVESGAANAYVVTLDPAPLAYSEGMSIDFKVGAGNTGASTINVNGLGVKTLRGFDGEELVAGQVPTGAIVTARYDGAVFRLNNVVGVNVPADNSATNAKLADMAQATIKGRAAAAGTGDPQDLSAAQIAAILAGTALTSTGFNLAVGNAAFGASGDNVILTLDENDAILFNRTANVLSLLIGGATSHDFQAAGALTNASSVPTRATADDRYYPKAAAIVTAAGALGSGAINIASVSKPDTGSYVVNFTNDISGGYLPIVIAQGPASAAWTLALSTSIAVSTFNAAGSAADATITVVILKF